MKAGVDGTTQQDLVYSALDKYVAPWEAVGVTSEEAMKAVVSTCQYPLLCGWVVSQWASDVYVIGMRWVRDGGDGYEMGTCLTIRANNLLGFVCVV